jgi:hypothetical protein
MRSKHVAEVTFIQSDNVTHQQSIPEPSNRKIWSSPVGIWTKNYCAGEGQQRFNSQSVFKGLQIMTSKRHVFRRISFEFKQNYGIVS